MLYTPREAGQGLVVLMFTNDCAIDYSTIQVDPKEIIMVHGKTK